MFLIDPNPTFTADVPVVMGETRQELRTTFRVLPDHAAMEFDLTDVEGIKAFLRDVVVTFHDLVSVSGSPLEPTEEVRETLLSFQHIRVALIRGYWGEITRARAGN